MYDNYGDDHGDGGLYDEQPDPLGEGMRNEPVRDRCGGRRAEDEFEPSLSMTTDRREFFRRLCYIWNGNKIQGHYLVEDGGFPSWHDLFGNLDSRELEAIRKGPELNGDGYVQTRYIDRKKVPYDLTEKGRTLINKANYPPRELKGDQFESLQHRVGVYLAFSWLMHSDAEHVETYFDVENYTVDVLGSSGRRPLFAVEVVTDHHNYELYRSTYEKLEYLDHEYDIAGYFLFDSRATAYKVFNYLHRCGLVDLPNGPFDSNPRTRWGRDQTKKMYVRDDGSCICDWHTITTLWDLDLDFTPEDHLSEDW